MLAAGPLSFDGVIGAAEYRLLALPDRHRMIRDAAAAVEPCRPFDAGP